MAGVCWGSRVLVRILGSGLQACDVDGSGMGLKELEKMYLLLLSAQTSLLFLLEAPD